MSPSRPHKTTPWTCVGTRSNALCHSILHELHPSIWRGDPDDDSHSVDGHDSLTDVARTFQNRLNAIPATDPDSESDTYCDTIDQRKTGLADEIVKRKMDPWLMTLKHKSPRLARQLVCAACYEAGTEPCGEFKVVIRSFGKFGASRDFEVRVLSEPWPRVILHC